MVAHLWANQSQREARSGNGNFHFEGDAIYSYREIVARLLPAKGKRPAVALFLEPHTSSVTTSHHHHLAWGALRPGYSTFGVPSLGHEPGRKDPDHKENYAALLQRFDERAAKAMRQQRKLWIVDHLRGMQTAANGYARIFRVASETTIDRNHRAMDDKIDAIVDRWERLDQIANDPKRIAKRERERVSRQARLERQLRDGFIAGMLNWRDRRKAMDLPGIQELARFYHRTKIDAWINTPITAGAPFPVVSLPCTAGEQSLLRRAAEYANAAKIANWRAGAHIYGLPYELPTMLRIKGDKIETSKGAEFPVEHGKRAFPIIAELRERGQGWHRNGHSIHLGHFAIDEIEPNGAVHAGCHIVEWPEIERCARELGLIQ